MAVRFQRIKRENVGWWWWWRAVCPALQRTQLKLQIFLFLFIFSPWSRLSYLWTKFRTTAEYKSIRQEKLFADMVGVGCFGRGKHVVVWWWCVLCGFSGARMIGRNELSIGDQQRTRSTGAPRSLACESVENILTPLACYSFICAQL
jgi:hypothetical protein